MQPCSFNQKCLLLDPRQPLKRARVQSCSHQGTIESTLILCISEVFFKIKFIYLWILSSCKYLFLMIKIDTFLGDLCDVSAKTATLLCISATTTATTHWGTTGLIVDWSWHTDLLCLLLSVCTLLCYSREHFILWRVQLYVSKLNFPELGRRGFSSSHQQTVSVHTFRYLWLVLTVSDSTQSQRLQQQSSTNSVSTHIPISLTSSNCVCTVL